MQFDSHSDPLQVPSAFRTATPTERPSGRPAASCWLTGLGLVTVCSWGRYLATGSLRVDDNYPTLFAGTALFTGLVVGWGLLVWGWSQLLLQPPPTAVARRLAFTGMALAAPMLPLLSNDVFSLLAYASLAADGHDVYASVHWLPGTAFSSWIGERWGSVVCVYGPTTLVSAMPAALVGENPWLALAILRLSWLLPLAGAMELSFRVLRDRPFFHAMLWLNPLLVVEGLGQLHADVLGAAAVVIGIGVMLTPRPGKAVGCLLYTVAVLGENTRSSSRVLWFWLFGARGCAPGSCGLRRWAPRWRQWVSFSTRPSGAASATITEPIHALASMNPGGSITEIAGDLIPARSPRRQLVLSADLPTARPPLELDRASKGPIWFAISLVLRVVFVGVAVRQLVGMHRAQDSDGTVARGTGSILVAAVTLASHRFSSQWYLMAALPFFGLCCDQTWRRWWLLVVPFAVATEFIHVLPRSALLLPIWSVLTNGGVVVVFLWSFRGRFLRLDPAREPAPDASAGVR